MHSGAEDRHLSWLRRRAGQLGFDRIGDDAAIVPAGGPWAVTQDHQIEGVHFPSGLDPLRVARRLLRVNLSDLAATGACPRFALLALSCPAEFDKKRFFRALLDECRRFEVELIGGDLAGNDRVTAALTLLGTRPARGRWVTRGTGRPGDSLWLAGTLGLSALGRFLVAAGARTDFKRLRLPEPLDLEPRSARLARSALRQHLEPKPQLEVGRWLSRRQRAAAIDISDGFSIDLHRLCRESDIGARVSWDALPLQAGFASLCRQFDLDPASLVLGGGEDYALLFALSPRVKPPSTWSCHRIGELREDRRVLLVRDGRPHPLPVSGWDHFPADR